VFVLRVFERATVSRANEHRWIGNWICPLVLSVPLDNAVSHVFKYRVFSAFHFTVLPFKLSPYAFIITGGGHHIIN